MVRRSRTGDQTLLADWSSRLTVDGVNSLVTLDLPADMSAAWDWRRGEYDIEVYPTTPDETKAVRILQGVVTVDPEVTRS